MKQKIVVIGGIAAGTSAAVKARRTSEEAEIILYEKYKYISYATCGLPYYVSGKIPDSDSLIINTLELFEKRFNLKINILCEVIEIDPATKTITVKNLKDGSIFKDGYDKLIIATGSKPVSINPEIENAKNSFNLRTIDDGERLKGKIDLVCQEFQNYKEPKVADVKKAAPVAVIIGGGYIGLELLDAFLKKGFNVTVVEKMDQILPLFDFEIIEYLENYLTDKGIRLLKNQEVIGFKKDGNGNIITIKTSGGNEFSPDIIFSGTGARPDTGIALKCGIKTGESGAISVDEYMRTNVADIYAAGDCCECADFISGKRQSYLLAGIAGMQGRTAGYNAAGGNDRFTDSNPTSIIKVLDVFVAKTGISLKEAKRAGINAAKIELHFFSHGGYYPGAQMIHMMIVYNKDKGTIIGFEAIGKEAVDKKTDIISVAIKAKMKIRDLVFLNFSYHPETSSAKDAINILGMIGENIKKGENLYMDVDELKKKIDSNGKITILDVRAVKEFRQGHIDRAINIPLDELRENLSKLDKMQPIVVYCRTGYRSYLAFRILKNSGFKNAFNLNGSYLSWQRKL